MEIEVITREDLQALRSQLLRDIKELLAYKNSSHKSWLRSSEVRKMLGISAGTLQAFRVSGKLKSTKVGGIFFYRHSDIEKLFDENAEAVNQKKTSGER